MSYQDVRQRAGTIKAAVERRFMPPWLPEPSDAEFVGQRWLSDTHIDVIRRWIAQGLPEGDPAHLPPPPRFTDAWQLGDPDLVITLPEPYTLQADRGDVWRNFVVPVPLATTRHVKTVELRPGSTRVVHHALVGIDATRSSRRRDDRDPGPGFGGMEMGDAQFPDGHLVGWTPGMTPFPGVSGQAWRLDPGTDLVLQLHLIPSGKPEVVNPSIGIYFSDTPPGGPPLYLLRLDADAAIDIAPGERHFVVMDSFTLPVDVNVRAIYPHAHFLATTMEAAATLPDGTIRRLLRIARWDFKWQDIYRFASPMALPRGTRVSMRYVYDNSVENPQNPNHPPKRVTAGPRASDEMAHLQLQVTAESTHDLSRLREAFYRHALTKNAGDAWLHYELANVLRERGAVGEAIRSYSAALAIDPSHAAARNNLGVALADHGQIDDAIRQFRQALRLEPDFGDAYYNLANALRAAGRLDEAIRHYRQALALEPHLAEARINLGEILASRGQLPAAVAEFREAVKRGPESAEAHNSLGAALGMQGYFTEAIEHFRLALQLDPGHTHARDNLAVALERAAASPPRR
jgi:tetratricopeptide (TPR) repeat protein